jgi:hypothetical protein
MSVLNSCVEVVPGRSFFGGGAGGGGGSSVAPPIEISPATATALDTQVPIITIDNGLVYSWEEALTTAPTGVGDFGNNLSFVPYKDDGTPAPAGITFQRSNGAVIADNLQIQGYVYLPTGGGTLPLQPIVITGEILPGTTNYVLPSGNSFFTPKDTGLYSVELECVINIDGQGQFIIPPPAFFRATLTNGASGGSVVVKPWYAPLTTDGGVAYLTTQNNTFELLAGLPYGLVVSAINPNQSPILGAGLWGMFLVDGTTPANPTANIQLFVNVVSHCRVNTDYEG